MNEIHYTLDEMIKIFEKHYEQGIKDKLELQRKVSEGLLDHQEWMNDPFSISLALHCICKEIKEIKDRK